MKTMLVLGLILWVAYSSSAAVVVRSEHLNPASPAWNFKTVPGPSGSDVATSATIAVVGNQVDHESAPPQVLPSGRDLAQALRESAQARR